MNILITKKTSNPLSFIWVISLLTLYSFQCNDCESELHDSASYTANISPQEANFLIGDTITLSSSINSDIQLDNSGDFLDISDQSIFYKIQVFQVKPNNEVITDGIEDFQISSKKGIILENLPSTNVLTRTINSVCDSDKCEFEIDLIPSAKGIYCIQLLTSTILETECEFISFIKNEFGVDNNNFSLCEEINTSQFRLTQGGPFYNNPGGIANFYFFKVS